MLRSCFGKIAIGFLVTVMTSNADLEYLTREQIDKVRENVGSRLHIIEHSFCHIADSSTEMGEHVLTIDRCGVVN